MAADPFGVVWVCGDDYPSYANIYRYDDTGTGLCLGNSSSTGGLLDLYDAIVIDPNNSSSKAKSTTAIFIADAKFYVNFTMDGGANQNVYGDITNRVMTTPANDVLWFQDQYNHDQTHSVPVCDAKLDPLVPGKIWVSGEGC